MVLQSDSAAVLFALRHTPEAACCRKGSDNFNCLPGCGLWSAWLHNNALLCEGSEEQSAIKSNQNGGRKTHRVR